MSPKRLPTRAADIQEARDRLRVGRKYLEVADLIEDEGGAMVTVCIGVAVLAGIAASDAICAAVLGERYSGGDHQAAADVLERVDSELAKRLRRLVALKNKSHYGAALLTARDQRAAMRDAHALVDEARTRTV